MAWMSIRTYQWSWNYAGKSSIFMFTNYIYGMEANSTFIEEVARFQCLFPNASWTAGWHQRLRFNFFIFDMFSLTYGASPAVLLLLLLLLLLLSLSGRISGYQKLFPTFPGLDNCLMVTECDFLEMEASLTKREISKWKYCWRLVLYPIPLESSCCSYPWLILEKNIYVTMLRWCYNVKMMVDDDDD